MRFYFFQNNTYFLHYFIFLLFFDKTNALQISLLIKIIYPGKNVKTQQNLLNLFFGIYPIPLYFYKKHPNASTSADNSNNAVF